MLRYSAPIAKPKEAPMLTVIADAMMIAARQRTEPAPRSRTRTATPHPEDRYKWRFLGML